MKTKKTRHPYDIHNREPQNDSPWHYAWRLGICMLICLLACWALSSCAPRTVCDSVYDQRVSEKAVTTTILADSSRITKDSTSTMTYDADTTKTQITISDSTILETVIETVITNTVNEQGIIIGTDRVTTRTHNRDHYRNQTSNTSDVHDRYVNVSRLLADSTGTTCFTLRTDSSNMECVSRHDTSTTTDNRTWFERAEETVGKLTLMFMAVCSVMWIGYVIYRRRSNGKEG